MSTAWAIVADKPRKNDATIAFFIIDLSFLYWGCAHDLLLGISPPDPHRLAAGRGSYSSVLFAFDRDGCQPGKTECARRRRCHVDNAPTDKGAAVIDRDNNRPSVAAIGNSNL
jgi:hypothetical protein